MLLLKYVLLRTMMIDRKHSLIWTSQFYHLMKFLEHSWRIQQYTPYMWRGIATYFNSSGKSNNLLNGKIRIRIQKPKHDGFFPLLWYTDSQHIDSIQYVERRFYTW